MRSIAVAGNSSRCCRRASAHRHRPTRTDVEWHTSTAAGFGWRGEASMWTTPNRCVWMRKKKKKKRDARMCTRRWCRWECDAAASVAWRASRRQNDDDDDDRGDDGGGVRPWAASSVRLAWAATCQCQTHRRRRRRHQFRSRDRRWCRSVAAQRKWKLPRWKRRDECWSSPGPLCEWCGAKKKSSTSRTWRRSARAQSQCSSRARCRARVRSAQSDARWAQSAHCWLAAATAAAAADRIRCVAFEWSDRRRAACAHCRPRSRCWRHLKMKTKRKRRLWTRSRARGSNCTSRSACCAWRRRPSSRGGRRTTDWGPHPTTTRHYRLRSPVDSSCSGRCWCSGGCRSSRHCPTQTLLKNPKKKKHLTKLPANN